jgi:membrane protein implicated in regulation of membrane protease activity
MVYTASRIGLFAISVAVLALTGLSGLWLLAAALLVSGLLSFVLLSRQRDAMSAAVVERSDRMRQRMRERTEAEDDLGDDSDEDPGGEDATRDGP